MNAVVDDMGLLKRAAETPILDREAAIAFARERLLADAKGREAPPYPMQALGVLAPACEAIASAGQIQQAMVGQCLLGAASLLTQGLHNVETLAGKRPLSLFALTLGDSGDGKSTAQGVALRPVHEWQRKAVKQFDKERQEYERTKLGRKRGDDPLDPPVSPFRLVSDATVEGLRRDLDAGVCSQGVFTDEAATMLSGYGMNPDNRSKTAAMFSKLWDEGYLSVSRATGPRVERYGLRVATHLLIQPMAAAESVGDPLLSSLGFWPRFLVALPAPQVPRVARAFEPEKIPEVEAYWDRCDSLLAEQLPVDANDSPILLLDDEARYELKRQFESFEQEARLGSLQAVKPFALRASEQACRIAGVLSAFEGKHVVTGDTMRGALALVAYSIKTWRVLLEEGTSDERRVAALSLYEWLTRRPGGNESLATIVNGGPTRVRTKFKRNAALSVLEEEGLAIVIGGRVQALFIAGPGKEA